MISILWPDQSADQVVDFSSSVTDLELGELASLMFQGKRSSEAIDYISSLVTSDPETIKYREACISDFLQNPQLVEIFESLKELLQEMQICTTGIRENANGLTNHGGLSSFKETLDKLEKLFGSKSNMIDENDLDNYFGQLFRASIFTFRLAKAYTKAIDQLRSALSEIQIQSEALISLKNWAAAAYVQEAIPESISELNKISEEWDNIGAFSVDILLDQSMNITGMELISIEPKGYAREGVLTVRDSSDSSGLSRLTDFPQGGATARFQECLMTALGTALRSKLVKLRDAVCRIPVRYVKDLYQLNDELPFYISASKFCERLTETGAAICCPTASENYFLKAEGVYPISPLLIQGHSVESNDISLPIGGTINFLTGANSSGKTTLLISAGQLQWLYQLGWWLPCKSAEMKPADGILTLFASGESEEVSDSRMGLEAQKLELIRSRMTENSIVLLNEPMTSTNAGEGIQICMEFLTDFIKRRISGMIVTHYNEMYGMLQERLRELSAEEKLVSYVMQIDETADGIAYPYRLVQEDPGRSSHASEIVSKAGLKLDLMLSTLSAAGLDVRPDAEVWSRLHTALED